MSRSDQSPRLNFRAFEAGGDKVNIWDRRIAGWVFPSPVDRAFARRWAINLMRDWAATRVDALFSQPASSEEFEAQEAYRKNIHERQDVR